MGLDSRKVFLPPATIGILGGGQLGRMLILAGRAMGYRFITFDPSPGSCAGVLADQHFAHPFDDLKALQNFAEACDLVTLEFENIPGDTLKTLSSHVPVRPSQKVLEICQHRQREKLWLRKNGFACAPFAVVTSKEELSKACCEIGFPCVLKTAQWGYDGKGQSKLEHEDDIPKAWTHLNAEVAVLEGWVNFEAEYSVICARDIQGKTHCFPPGCNEHRRHILHRTDVPAQLHPKVLTEAMELASAIAEAIEVEGLLAVELFRTANAWLVNELAPRPHNSGHYTMNACPISQFEQHIRAICGLPLGSTELLAPVTMINLLGDVWQNAPQQQPTWDKLLTLEGAHLHLYDKGEARPGRKMGHLNLLHTTEERVRLAENQLGIA